VNVVNLVVVGGLVRNQLNIPEDNGAPRYFVQDILTSSTEEETEEVEARVVSFG
jgi:uncharacterized membrane protein (UPF0182 family)